ncbi:MAG: SDR family oxidoreductase [Hyphomicrobiales bacterium]|nr:SDR family oxidoreductase [Hyphomicrobiales bacterium]
MDLGIAGRKAIVCASSKGLGKGCARALAEAGCEIVMNGRNADVLEAAAKEIAAATGAKVTPVACDVGTEAGRKALLAVCPNPDILVNNNGGPPPKDFRQISRDEMIAGLDANMMTPILLVQATIDGMAERGFGRIIDITSASVRTSLVGLDLSSGARAGLTAFLAAAARQFVDRNVTINHILPGVFDTDRIATATGRMAAMKGVTPEEFRKQREAGIPAKRFGTADEFGKLCAFLASAHAGYITGQSFLIDGGAFNTVI